MALKSRCCWCGGPFVRGRLLRADVWVCSTPACQQRQLQHHIAARVRKPENKDQDGLGQPKLLYLPLPRQVDMLDMVDTGTPRILVGGARGGSKSHFLRWLHYRQCLKFPGIHTLILRRKFPELEQTHILRAKKEAKLLGGEYFSTRRVIEWPNDSLTRFGHCETDDDAENYLSSEYDLISFDELVTFPFEMYIRIVSSVRSSQGENGPPPQVVNGTNPGGPQSYWVKQWYIDRLVEDDYPDYDPQDYGFVFSKLEDNPYLDAGYEKTLLALPPMLRRAYRDGDWDVWPGQFFSEWNRSQHVADWAGFTPEGCRVICGLDWGYMRNGCCLWMAVTPDGRIYVFDEYLFKMKITSAVAKEIKRRNREWKIRPIVMADTQMWGGQDQSGETMSETFARAGVPLVQANKDRVNGWARVRAWLAGAPDGRPWLQSHSRCAYLNRTLPQAQALTRQPDDIDGSNHDATAAIDAIRYALMSRPAPDRTTTVKIYEPGSLGGLLQREGRKERAGRLRKIRRYAA